MRFVIQRHERPNERTHWDLMLEEGMSLKTYRIDCYPERIGQDRMDAVRIEDHRLKYLDYEGTVSKGRGYVMIEDKGLYQLEGLSQDCMHILFDGQLIKGRVAIYFTIAQANEEKDDA